MLILSGVEHFKLRNTMSINNWNPQAQKVITYVGNVKDNYFTVATLYFF